MRVIIIIIITILRIVLIMANIACYRHLVLLLLHVFAAAAKMNFCYTVVVMEQ